MSDKDVDAERSALKGLIYDPTLINTSQLLVEMFTSNERRLIFEALLELNEKNLRIDEVTVLDRLPANIRSACVEELKEIHTGFGASANYPAYEAITLKSHIRRVIIAQGQVLAEDPDALDNALQILTQTGGSSRWEYDQGTALSLATALLDRMQHGTAGAATGFRELDRVLSYGMVPGRLTVIGGRPSMGKTALATSIALSCGVPVGFFSSEMSVAEITLRMISSLSSVPLSVAQGGMDKREWDMWNDGSQLFKKSSIMINDRPGITPAEIARQSRKWVYNNGAKLIVIDYLQRLGGDSRKDRTENIRNAVMQSKEIARAMNIHTILLSQVKREVETRQDKRPMMSDFDGAGTIEAEADHAIAVYRPSVYDNSARKQDAELIVCKNRHGVSRTIFADFLGEIATFSETTRKNDAPF
jgi:replicative DNA helicase